MTQGGPLESGDRMVERDEICTPNIIKIDVEGHEREVIEGLRSTLGPPAVRSVFIELHFATLEEKGFPDAPRKLRPCYEMPAFRSCGPTSHICMRSVANCHFQ